MFSNVANRVQFNIEAYFMGDRLNKGLDSFPHFGEPSKFFSFLHLS